jgi:hypothetical protein
MLTLKKAAGTLVTATMLAGLATMATATTASAASNCYGSWYANPNLSYTYWVPAWNLSQSNQEDDCVIDLQQMLNQRYPNANLATDGYFGSKTLSWVLRFQGDYSWCDGKADGIVGPNTYSCLDFATGNGAGAHQ